LTDRQRLCESCRLVHPRLLSQGPNGAIKPGGAWIYKTPKAAASQIANHVAFYPFVKHA
jgi:hypothetical protein